MTTHKIAIEALTRYAPSPLPFNISPVASGEYVLLVDVLAALAPEVQDAECQPCNGMGYPDGSGETCSPCKGTGERELTQDETRQIYRLWAHCEETPHSLYKRFLAAAAPTIQQEAKAEVVIKAICGEEETKARSQRIADKLATTSSGNSAPDAAVQGSVDTPEFRTVLLNWHEQNKFVYAEESWRNLIAYIDAHIAQRAAVAEAPVKLEAFQSEHDNKWNVVVKHPFGTSWVRMSDPRDIKLAELLAAPTASTPPAPAEKGGAVGLFDASIMAEARKIWPNASWGQNKISESTLRFARAVLALRPPGTGANNQSAAASPLMQVAPSAIVPQFTMEAPDGFAEELLTPDEFSLYQAMSDISEERWFASWLGGLEFTLWSALQDGELQGIDRDALAYVAAMSVKTGKWIIWRGEKDLPLDEHGPYAIPLIDWLAIYDAKNDMHDPVPPAVAPDLLTALEGVPLEHRYGYRQGWEHARATPAVAPEQAKSPDANVEKNRELLLQRSVVGLDKYGVTTVDSPISHRDWLQHALLEALDMANYLQAAINRPEVAPEQASVRDAALEEAAKQGLTPERIDWLANCACPGGAAYPHNVKVAIIAALHEVATVIASIPCELPLMDDRPMDEHEATMYSMGHQGAMDAIRALIQKA